MGIRTLRDVLKLMPLIVCLILESPIYMHIKLSLRCTFCMLASFCLRVKPILEAVLVYTAFSLKKRGT